MSDTIAAISTPPGEGGIGIVRISGDRSLEIMNTLFRPCPEVVKPRYAYFGTIVDPKTGQVIDEAICIYMKAPHSYTCEDVVEIQAHGGIVSIRTILRTVLDAGAEWRNRESSPSWHSSTEEWIWSRQKRSLMSSKRRAACRWASQRDSYRVD